MNGERTKDKGLRTKPEGDSGSGGSDLQSRINRDPAKAGRGRALIRQCCRCRAVWQWGHWSKARRTYVKGGWVKGLKIPDNQKENVTHGLCGECALAANKEIDEWERGKNSTTEHTEDTENGRGEGGSHPQITQISQRGKGTEESDESTRAGQAETIDVSHPRFGPTTNHQPPTTKPAA